VTIHTPEGRMLADIGGWVVREPFPTDERKFYPVKDAIFRRTGRSNGRSTGSDGR
jgi:hypothetical protein